MISNELKTKFEKVIEFENIEWHVVDLIIQKDANTLRPIKGVAFEEYFKKILRHRFPGIDIKDGLGDSDVDLYVNGFKLQLKTLDKGSTKYKDRVGVALHKTHGLEKRPYNLYSTKAKIFDFLVLLHPESGIYIIPYNKIPRHKSWPGYLDDPAKINWRSKRLNNWKKIGLEEIDGVAIDDRTPPKESELPFLSKETFLEDYEIIETLCKPEYFRAAVMGLKGNIKEYWFENYVRKLGYRIKLPIGPYPKYDIVMVDKGGIDRKIQIKGTSKNMCNLKRCTIGVEVMGTHGRFPKRGYTKRMIDYVAMVISANQLPPSKVSREPHFLIIPVRDLPLHYKIGKGKIFNEPDWDKKEYSDVIYPNMKLKLKGTKKGVIEFIPDLTSYGRNGNFDIISKSSPFRKAGPYKLDVLPNIFHN